MHSGISVNIYCKAWREEISLIIIGSDFFLLFHSFYKKGLAQNGGGVAFIVKFKYTILYKLLTMNNNYAIIQYTRVRIFVASIMYIFLLFKSVYLVYYT